MRSSAAQYRPLNAPELVGGDFYDVFETSEGRWAIVMGDVAGKGVDAAALTAAARWTLRATLTRDNCPVESLRHLNDDLLRQGWAERYLSVVAAVVETSDEGVVIRYSSGGHPPPVRRRADGRAEVLPVEGDLIGLFPNASWSSLELTLGLRARRSSSTPTASPTLSRPVSGSTRLGSSRRSRTVSPAHLPPASSTASASPLRTPAASATTARCSCSRCVAH